MALPNWLSYGSILRRFLPIIALILLTFVPRLMTLGTILTIDEPLWRDRGNAFINGVATGHFDQTLVAGQPGVTTAWLSGLTVHWHSLAITQASIGVVTGLLVLLITYLLSLLWGQTWAVFAGCILALNPFLLAHSRVVHTDALLGLFYVASLLALIVAFLPRPQITWRYIVASGVLGGLALLTKITAIILVPTTGLIILYCLWLSDRYFRRALWAGGLWFCSLLVTVALFWPAFLVSAPNVLNFMISQASTSVAGTHSADVTSNWWYYLREIPFRITPLTLIFFPVGLAGLVWRKKNLDTQLLVIPFLIATVLFVGTLSNSADKGARYVLPACIMLLLIAVVGMRFLASCKVVNKTAILACLAIIMIGWLAITDWQLHPYYLAYYDQLYPMEVMHKLGWGEGLEQAAQWITMNRPGSSVVTYYPRILSYFYSGNVDSINYESSNNADLVVIYRGMLERDANSVETDMVHEYLDSGRQPLKVIYVNHLPYVWIFAIS